MIVNPDVDAHTKTLNNRKIVRKMHKNTNLVKTKRILKPKYKLVGVRFSLLACQRGIHPSAPVTYVTGYNMFIIMYSHTLSCTNSTATRYKLVA